VLSQRIGITAVVIKIPIAQNKMMNECEWNLHRGNQMQEYRLGRAKNK